MKKDPKLIKTLTYTCQDCSMKFELPLKSLDSYEKGFQCPCGSDFDSYINRAINLAKSYNEAASKFKSSRNALSNDALKITYEFES